MVKKMLIDATHSEETRVVVVDGNKVEEFDFESENRRQLAGNIYLAKVTRVEPSLQAAFIEYGGNRHGFLAFSEIHPDYYQIPVADRETLIAEERAYADAQRALENDEEEPKKTKSSKSVRNKAQSSKQKDAIETKPVEPSDISGMETIDFESDHKLENAMASTDLEYNSAKALEDDISNASKAEKDNGQPCRPSVTSFVINIIQCKSGLPKCLSAITSGLSPSETKYSVKRLASFLILSLILILLHRSLTSL